MQDIPHTKHKATQTAPGHIDKCKGIYKIQKKTHKDITQTKNRGRMEVTPWNGQRHMSLEV